MRRSSLSLVTVSTLDDKSVDELIACDLIDSVALAPTHFGRVETDGRVDTSNLNCLRRLAESNLAIHSLQGLFFQPQGMSRNFPNWLRNRLSSIAELCALLDIKTLVIGAPQLRVDSQVWNHVLDSVTEHPDLESIRIYIENICVESADGSVHQYGLSTLDPKRFGFVCDFANAIACPIHRDATWVTRESISMVHVSGPHHAAIRTREDAAAVGPFFRATVDVLDILWEFANRSVGESIEALALSLNNTSHLRGRNQENT